VTEDRFDDHLPADEIAAYVDGALAGDERSRVEAHLAECADCRAEVLDVSRIVRTAPDARRTAPRRVWIPAVAAAALVLLWVGPRALRAPTDEVHRDGPTTTAITPRPVAPVGTVASARTLVWSTVPGADRYRVTLFDADGRVLYETQGADTSAALPDSTVLAPGRTYLWKVEARTGWNRWEPSQLVEFSIAGGAPR
jgi:hypothetical protein